jgi:hypothetical protein
VTSNQTQQPLTLYGERFRPGLALILGPPFSRRIPLAVRGPSEAYAVLPADLSLPAELAEERITLTLSEGGGEAALVLVNDRAFADPTALALTPDGRFIAALSGPTDELVVYDTQTKKQTRVATGDGPSGLAGFQGPQGLPFFAVVHAFSPELRLYRADAPKGPPQFFPAPTQATGVVVEGETAYVAERIDDTVRALDLSAGGKERWRTAVAPDPRALLWAPPGIAVGSLGSGEVQWLEPTAGQLEHTWAPDPKTSIVGGGTEKFGWAVMGGKAVRSLAWLPEAKALLVSSIGPNVGPNPQRMEVSMNSGVAVVQAGRFVRHLGLGEGVLEGLAADEPRGLLYAADIASGRVMVFSLPRLLESDAAARGALLAEFGIPPPEGFPTARPAADFAPPHPVGVEVHSGPRSLVRSPDGNTLYVLNRFSGQLAVVDVREAAQGRARIQEQVPLFSTLTQVDRRLGQVLYHADLGRTAMSCDACHPDGEADGVLFEKTRPLRIYRSLGIRGARETPPFFTPASTRTLEETMREVGNRNRFHRLEMLPLEIHRLATFARGLALWPNPFRAPDGGPLAVVPLPGGRTGRPAMGRTLFEQRLGCVGCHPPPHFTLDQDPATRGRYLDVGTPHLLPLRTELQDGSHRGFAIPSLLGLWNGFPLLGTGAAGFQVRPDGTLATERHPLSPLLEQMGPGHGNAAALTPEERDDLAAYLLTL